MEISPPESFIAFLQAIIEAQTKADLWKSKLFYFPPDQIASMFQSDIQTPSKSGQAQEQPKITVCIEKIMKFLNSRLNSETSWSTQDSQKVICKYFNFHKAINCPKETFLKRLKPTNNKLILTIQKENLKIEQTLIGLFSCILQGYSKIKQKRQECSKNITPILSYFKDKIDFYKGLSIQMLKDFTFEANLYGRINFSYLKEYVFGDDQEVIRWETLFGVKIQQGIDKIQELSEENIVSEHVIMQPTSRLCESVKKEVQQQNPSQMTPKKKSCIYLQSISEIKSVSDAVSISKIPPVNEDYSNVLNQINQIETLLNKTKERYQKNRQDLQHETHIIKIQHLKRSQNLGKLSSSAQKTSSKYQNLKIHQTRERIPLKVDRKEGLLTSEAKPVEVCSNQSQIRKTEKPTESPYKALNLTKINQESRVQTLVKQQETVSEVNESVRNSNFSRVSVQSTERREAGKIKRRSVSRDAEKRDSTKISTASLTPNYSEYEAVLQQIKREESMYKRMVQDREKILFEKKIEKRLDLGVSSSLHHKTPSFNNSVSSEMSVSQQSSHKDIKINALKKSPSQSRYEEIMKEIETNTLSRSRVSSKKREEIVQKATSEARLRIQEIQNRALKRLAKLDTEVYDKNHLKQSNYLKLETSEAVQSDTPKYRPMKENTQTTIRSQKPTQPVNLFMNDLFNERPNLKLSTATSMYKAKY